MYIAPTIKTDKIDRAGVLSCVSLNGFKPGIKKTIEKTKICIDKETKEMYFEKQGDSVVVITDKLGVREGLLGTLFLNKECVFVDFHAGELFIEEDGKVYSIQETGKVKEVESIEGIKWVTVKDIRGVVEPTVRAKYNQECRKVVKHYMENLMYTVEMRNTYIPETKEIPSSYMYQVKVYGLASDISLGCVEFERLEKESKTDKDKEREKEEQEQIEKEEKEEAERVEREARQLKEQERELEARYKMIKEGGDYEGDIDTEEVTSEELEGMLMEL